MLAEKVGQPKLLQTPRFQRPCLCSYNILSAPSSTSCKLVAVGGSLSVCSHLEVESSDTHTIPPLCTWYRLQPLCTQGMNSCTKVPPRGSPIVKVINIFMQLSIHIHEYICVLPEICRNMQKYAELCTCKMNFICNLLC